MERIAQFFNSEEFMPHGHCYLWKPEILWLHIFSDAGIALAYYSIPAVLIYLTKKRTDLPFKNLFWLFGAFILLCGTTHLFAIWTVWHPDYALDGILKATTAIVSIITFFVACRLIPQALNLASPEKLERLNKELQDAYNEMEHKVAERTSELVSNNEILQNEIKERKITERHLSRAMERLTDSNDELQRFAHICSHDLQEPARAVAQFAGMMSRKYAGKLDDQADKYLHFMQEGAERMQQMIKSVLEYSQVDSQESKYSEVDLNEVMTNVTTDLQMLIKRNNAQINVAHMPVLYGDPVHFAQMFQNLISNALKFQKPDVQPVINIKAERNKIDWVFSVQDNGIGMKEEYLERIFLIFQRLNKREDYPGTGIGLAICKKIAERYGGKIWVKSSEGVGTTFYFSIPDAGAE